MHLNLFRLWRVMHSFKYIKVLACAQTGVTRYIMTSLANWFKQFVFETKGYWFESNRMLFSIRYNTTSLRITVASICLALVLARPTHASPHLAQASKERRNAIIPAGTAAGVHSQPRAETRAAKQGSKALGYALIISWGITVSTIYRQGRSRARPAFVRAAAAFSPDQAAHGFFT